MFEVGAGALADDALVFALGGGQTGYYGLYGAERQSNLMPADQTDLWDTAWKSDFTNALTHLRAIGGSVDDTLRRADQIVRLHWAAIQQVAEMLEEHDSVSGEQIDAVLVGCVCGYSADTKTQVKTFIARRPHKPLIY
jgi:hypothetical protein